MTDTAEAPTAPEIADKSQNESSRVHQAQIERQLWAIANQLRAASSMEPNEFKNYILGVLFYKFLSEKIEDTVGEYLAEDELDYEQAWANEEMREALVETLVEHVGYVIEPQHLFSRMVREIHRGAQGEFDVELLQEALTSLISSTKGHESEDDFDSLFDDLDLNSKKLGENVADRTARMADILTSINQISFHHDDMEIDVLGNAYEYMISNFAATAGKKAGEFYTPQAVSEILSRIITFNKPNLKSVYDPTCGSGSLLLRVAKAAKNPKQIKFYGQELGSTTYNLARMNMMLHGVGYERFDIRQGNTLSNDKFAGELFDGIAANPPYSAHWAADAKAAADDRFSGYGKLAPKTKADYAFVQHGLHHLEHDGAMAVVLPHGVLFRGAAEGIIRQYMLEKNWIDAVIGLPANIFYGTTIPTAVVVFRKNREADDKVLIIDASHEFVAGKNQNSLSDVNVDRILKAYEDGREGDLVEGFSVLVSLEDLKNNGYNLNISRYISTEINAEEVDLDSIADQLLAARETAAALEVKIQSMVASLHATTKETDA
jgi:type I restriction enzyme M protein